MRELEHVTRIEELEKQLAEQSQAAQEHDDELDELLQTVDRLRRERDEARGALADERARVRPAAQQYSRVVAALGERNMEQEIRTRRVREAAQGAVREFEAMEIRAARARAEVEGLLRDLAANGPSHHARSVGAAPRE
jgi:uncharacterized coiled-coil DUF342 family protein